MYHIIKKIRLLFKNILSFKFNMDEAFKEVLTHSWTDAEKTTIEKMINNMSAYKYLISKSMQKDIISLLDLAINVKTELEILRDKVKIIEKELHNM
jgi:hypothetical protein